MPKAFYNEQIVVIDGETLRLVINMRAIDAVESLLPEEETFEDVLRALNSGKPRSGTIGRLVWGLLREHHPELTLDHAASLMFGEPGVTMGLAVNSLLEAAFPEPAPDKAKGENPPKRRGASKLS